MHESGLVRELVRKADALVTADGAERAPAVTVRVGAFSHVSPSHLRGYFAEIARGTTVESAELVVRTDDDVTSPAAMDLVLVSVEMA